ncbi:acetyl-CoA acetyltransferase domain protein [Mycobacterium ulcerans str. Harvey]|uniref:Acetyl-CoA acetyltransferase domain protein n=1 Tax=Mycobacterium ulcerans str. Harvey TaxID=1299332 RepID=A0ABN0QVZ7_MYCUL|nr:acetyl-CoA acetyltransferase domain protein [Mycobacterium ulcerans str. Harvey]
MTVTGGLTFAGARGTTTSHIRLPPWPSYWRPTPAGAG